jgi:hypothetical protein
MSRTSVAVTKHGVNRSVQCSLPLFLLATILAVAACQKADIAPGKTIKIERQVMLGGVQIRASVFERTPDGGFLIAGATNRARALHVDEQGKLLWLFDDSREKEQGRYSSGFMGIVVLANGNYLLCGTKKGPQTQSENELTILSKDGKLLDRRTVISSSGQPFNLSEFGKCFRVKNEIWLTGAADNRDGAYTLIVKIDESASPISQILIPTISSAELGGPDRPAVTFISVETSKDSPATARNVSLAGEVIAKRELSGHRFTQLRSTDQTNKSWFLSYALGGRATLFEVDSALHDSAVPRDLGTFEARGGFVMPDGSLFLFGRDNSASMAWVGNTAPVHFVAGFGKQFSSYIVDEAVQISQDSFVTVRNSVNSSADDSGLVLAWIKIE